MICALAITVAVTDNASVLAFLRWRASCAGGCLSRRVDRTRVLPMFASQFFMLVHQFDETMEAPQFEKVTTGCNKCGVQCSKNSHTEGRSILDRMKNQARD